MKAVNLFLFGTMVYRAFMMKKKIDPKLYGLPAKTVLYQDSDKFVISINRKSRIVMKDAASILDKALKIKNIVKNAVIRLETSAPICSKSVKFLNENGIEIIENS